MNELILSEIRELKVLTVLVSKQVLTLNDVALLTGLSKSTLYKECSAKRLPHYKSAGGKYTYFDRNEINSWLLKNRVKTTDEINAEAATYAVTATKGKNRLTAS